MKRWVLLLLGGLLLASPAHAAWEAKFNVTIMDTTTAWPAASQCTTLAIPTAGASMVVVRIFSSDTCGFCGDSLHAIQNSTDGVNWAGNSQADGVFFSSGISAASNLKRSVAGGGRIYIITPFNQSGNVSHNFLTWPYIRLLITGTNRSNFTNRYQIIATVYRGGQ